MAAAGFYRLEVKPVSRSKGYSATAKAAYITRGVVYDARTGETHDYTRHPNQALFTGFYPPRNAQEWAQERESFWSAVEFREKRKDASLAREFVGALPHQMSLEHARYAVQDFVRENFTRRGLAADVAIHPAHDHGDEKNVHTHILVPMREIDKNGEWGEKHKQFDKDPETGKWRRTDKDELLHLRERFAHHVNRQLERFGYDIRVDHRSYEAQGIDREPTLHLGKRDAAKERQGVATKRGDLNREIEARNAERAQQPAREIETPEREPLSAAENARTAFIEQRRQQLAGNATVQEIGLAYAQARTAQEFVAVLEERGLTVCRVTEDEAERSKTQRDWLGETPRYEPGEYLVLNERGHAFRLDATTIHDHEEHIVARLSQIDGSQQLSLSQAQQVVDYQRDASPPEREEPGAPSVRETAKNIADAAELATGIAGNFFGSAIGTFARVGENVLGALSDFFTTPARPQPEREAPPEPRRREPVTPQQREPLRRTTPEVATGDPEVRQQQVRTGNLSNMPREVEEAIRRRAREIENERRDREHSRDRER